MYKEHPNLEKPKNEKARIWRYMDFTKFVSLLDKSALFFVRADKLPDPFEGSFPKTNVKLRPTIYKGIMPPKEIKDLSEFYKQYVKLTFISCWHLNNYQSAAMWEKYFKTNNGIAIRSTFGRLKDSFKDYKEHDIYIGEVKYISYTKDLIPEGPLFPYFHKRRSFEHEKELRAVIQSFSYKKTGEINWSKSPFNNRKPYISVDLDLLIDRIYLAPTCPEWQLELVGSVVSKYELNKQVIRSRLYDRDDRIVY